MLDPTSTTQYLTAESGRLVLHNPNPVYGTANSTFIIFPCGQYVPANVNGYTVTAKVEILNTMTSGLSPPNDIQIIGNNGKFIVVKDLTDPAGYQWLTLSGILTSDSWMVGISINFSDTFTGTVLVEEVTLTPP
jgi:hypothetical protein